MYVSIGPGGTAASNFAIGSVTATRSETGEPLVVAIVHNTGGRRLGISGDLTLTEGPGRLRAGPFPVKLESKLAPGDAASAAVPLDKRMPRGPWQAQIRLRSGSVQRTAVTTITFPAFAGPAKPAPAGEAESRPLIVVFLIILVVLLAVAALALLLRRAPRGRGGIGPAATT
jgi:hypothetical protein